MRRLCPMYLGVRAVIAKSIERIHKANLINFCVVPIELANQDDYEKISQGDNLRIDGLVDAIKGKDEVKIVEEKSRYEIIGKLNLSGRDREILLSGGLLKYTLEQANKKAGKPGKPNDEDSEIHIGPDDCGNGNMDVGGGEKRTAINYCLMITFSREWTANWFRQALTNGRLNLSQRRTSAKWR